MEMARKDLIDSKTPDKTSKIWAQDGKIRLDMAQDKQSVIFKDQTMYALDHSQKKCTVVDKATMDQAAPQMASAKQQMDARLAQMPPDQRAQVEKMMAQHGGMGGMGPGATPPRTLKETPRTDTVAGVSCKIWEVSVNNVKDQELCVAPVGSVKGGEEMLSSFKNMAKLFDGMRGQMGGDKMNQVWGDLDTIKGIPVLTRQFEDGKAVSEHRMLTSKSESVPSSSFDPPADYKVEKPSFAGGPGAGAPGGAAPGGMGAGKRATH